MNTRAWTVALDIVSLRELPPAPARRRPRNYDARVRAFRRANRRWIRGNAVTGFAIGQKQTAGVRKRTRSLIVYVERKLPLAECRHPVPRKVRVPGIGWVPTDVQVMPRMRAQSYRDICRPLQPGCNLGFNLPDAGTGTLACFVTSTVAGESDLSLLLSCEHVLCNDLRQRERFMPPGGTWSNAIEQPGPRHQAGHYNFRIGAIHRSGHIRFNGPTNRIDAALALIDDDTRPLNLALGLDLPIAGIGVVRDNQQVIKIGSASEMRFGQTIAPAANVPVEYPEEFPGGPKRTAMFARLVAYRCHCEEGDSGAPVLDKDTLELLGIHVAGSGDHGVFCPIDAICQELEVALP